MARLRRLWRLGCGFLLLVLLVGGAFLAHLLWFRPFSIRHFFLRQTLAFGLSSPEALSQVGALPSFRGFPHGRLDDRSPEALHRRMAFARETLATLREYDRASLSPDDQLSYDVLEWFLEQVLQDERFWFYVYPVNQMFGVQSSLPTFMMNTHPLGSPRNAWLYVERLRAFPTAFGQVIEGLRYRSDMGVRPPRFVYERSLEQIRELLAPAPADHPLVTTLRGKLDTMEEVDAEEKAAIVAAAEAAVRDAVLPAYRELEAYLVSTLPTLGEDDGVWALPDGDAFYAWTLRLFTTTDLSPGEIHELGLREVTRIEQEMDAILDAQGHTEGTVGERMRALAADPRFLYEESDAGRAELLADVGTILEEVQGELGPLFRLRPKSPIEVRRLPEFREASSPIALYDAPAKDGSRPGTFYVNLAKMRDLPRYGLRTLVYHEGVPGHHFQLALQTEQEDLPLFRNFAPFTAFVEGWALYAEALAADRGLMDDPYDRLGFLQAALWRAERLVVDTGIHHQRWTRQQAIDHMEATTGLPHNAVVNEVDRYIVAPGQACSYMVGKLAFVELREKARAALGDRFDLAAFHDFVLAGGALPLTLLERRVDDWIAQQRAGSAAEAS